MERYKCTDWARTDLRQGQYFSKHHPDCPNSKFIKVFRVTPGKGLNSCCEKNFELIKAWLDEAEPGDVITIEVLRMMEDVYANLPEYAGP